MILRVVIDTNVIVSGLLLPHSIPARVIDLWQAGRFRVVTCQQAVDELKEVLSRPKFTKKYPGFAARRDVFLMTLNKDILYTTGTLYKNVMDDPKDDMFISCAVEGEARYLISGDDDLGRLRRFMTVKIILPSSFLKLMQRYERLFSP